MKSKKAAAILAALLAAVFYALNMPFSKLLLEHIPSTILAGLLYLGAGIGTAIMFFCGKKEDGGALLTRADLPYTVGMIVLDILAPVLLMYGLERTSSASASLLNNFEIVATAIIALAIFKERISKMLWGAIALITIASLMLSFEDISALKFSYGSLFVLLAAACWGLENNCTRAISSKNTSEIVMLKGLCSGTGSLIIGLIAGEKLPRAAYILPALLLGFVAYGLSIFFYIRAQKELGAAKTSAYYAVAPFIGALLSFLILKERLSAQYAASMAVMFAGSVLATLDTLAKRHSHTHTHVITFTHHGTVHTYTITHSHPHWHLADGEGHIDHGEHND